LHVNGKRVPSIVKSILYVRRRKEALKIQRRQTWGPLPGKILGLTLDVTLLRGVQLRYLTLRVKLISGKLSGITLDRLPYLEGRARSHNKEGLRCSRVWELGLPPSLPSLQTT
jgi:hypothetical protein